MYLTSNKANFSMPVTGLQVYAKRGLWNSVFYENEMGIHPLMPTHFTEANMIGCLDTT